MKILTMALLLVNFLIGKKYLLEMKDEADTEVRGDQVEGSVRDLKEGPGGEGVGGDYFYWRRRYSKHAPR